MPKYVIERNVPGAAAMTAGAARTHGSRLPPDTRKGVGKVLYYVIIAIALLSALGVSGIDLSGLFLAGGIAGIVIGFATQSLFSNLISGIFLQIDKPMKIGDPVLITGKLPDVAGVVVEITTLSSRLRMFDGTYVRLPNSDVFLSEIRNYSGAAARRERDRGGGHRVARPGAGPDRAVPGHGIQPAGRERASRLRSRRPGSRNGSARPWRSAPPRAASPRASGSTPPTSSCAPLTSKARNPATAARSSPSWNRNPPRRSAMTPSPGRRTLTGLRSSSCNSGMTSTSAEIERWLGRKKNDSLWPERWPFAAQASCARARSTSTRGG